MAAFKPLSLSKFDWSLTSQTSAESHYWKSFNFPVTVKENGAIAYIEFSPADPRLFAVSASTSVHVYNTINCQTTRTLSKSHEAVYGGSFRKDGKLLVAGGDEGRVRLFDVDTKSLLRTFSGHTGAVHACKFTTDNLRVISFSNDKKVILWDVPGEVPLITYSDHTDYVHTGAVSKADNNVFISGSYDHTVKMYDSRTSNSVLTVDHGTPVENVLFFPSGGVVISAGGLEVKIWDVIGGGKLMAKLSHHHKTVTCLSFASQFKKLLSGSLDRHIKIYDVNTYQVVETLDFPSPILSVGIPSCDSSLAVGMSNGLLSIQNRSKVASEVDCKKDTVEVKQYNDPSKESIFVENKQEKRPAHEKFLRKFEVTRALDHVLRHHINENPEIAMAVIQELIRRESIKAAVAGGNEEKVVACLNFILKHIKNPAFTWLMVEFGNIVLDIYNTSVCTPKVKRQLQTLRTTLRKEIEYMKEMMALSGTIELLLAAGNVNDVDNSLENTSSPTVPLLINSKDAMES